MRIGHLVAGYLKPTENWIYSQMAAAPGMEPVVLNRGVVANLDAFPASRAIHASELDARACRWDADAWEQDGYSAAFATACRGHRVEVLHAHFATEGALAVPLAVELGLPLVTSFYGYDATVLPRDPAWQRALRELFRCGTLFLAEGPTLGATLVRLGCPETKVRVMPLPVAIPGQAATPSADEPATILICGRLVEKKGTDTSLQVLARLRALAKKPFRALIVGDGPERLPLARLHRKLGLGEQVRFAGALEPSAVSELLMTATAVLQMSRTAADGDAEGGSPVILSQAMAAGVPIVASRHCDIPWIVPHNRAGFIVDADDVDGAAKYLAQLVDQPQLREHFGLEGRDQARQRLSSEVAGARLAELYAGAAASGPARSPRRCLVLHRELADGIVIDLRRRGQDVDGLVRMTAGQGRTAELKTRAWRALGQAHTASGDHRAAAEAYAKLHRLEPDEPYAALDEARAWLQSDVPRNALTPLARFVTRHPHREYALAQALDACAGQPDVAKALVAKVATPAERLRIAMESLVEGPEAAGALKRAWRRFEREGGLRGADDPAREAALVSTFVAAMKLGDQELAAKLKWLLGEGQVRQPLLRYRVASALEQKGGEGLAWARRTFDELSRDRALGEDQRTGARIHAARIDQSKRSLA